MNDELHDEPLAPTLRRSRRWVANLGWLLGGALLAILLTVDPFGIHPFDGWLHGIVGRWHHAPDLEAPDLEKADAPKQLWTCGMHPQVIQDHPGQCPICGMDLVPMDADAGASPPEPAAAGERRILFYRNPMDPTVTSPVPMKDSMGMDYVPVYEEVESAAGVGGATIRIDPAVVQNMNVVTAAVERGDLSREIRTVGHLDYDQEKMVSVTTKFPGFVERVYVNYVGEPVRRGQPLFEIYSPELVQTQEELVSALAYTRRLESAPEGARQRAQALVEAARRRLSFWDISAAQVAKLEGTGVPQRTLTVSAPSGGVVMMRMAGLEGMSVRPGMELYHLADLSSLWASVEVFEDQLSWLEPGSQAEISLSYFPGETFHGRVRFVEPQVQEKTRTVGLRIEVPNRDGRLRPGMYATVRFAPVIAHDVVTVPSLAVLRTGERNVVIVSIGDGRFVAREVRLGAAGERQVEVLSGLDAGEEVVTSAQFLIDSESNLREAVQKLLASQRNETPPMPPAAGHAGH